MNGIVVEFSQDRQYIYAKIHPTRLRQTLKNHPDQDFESLFFEVLMESGYSSFSYQLDTEQLEELARMPWKNVRQTLIRRVAVRTEFTLFVEVASDQMSATARLKLAFEDEQVSADQVVERLIEEGITHGHERDTIATWVKAKTWDTPCMVATGKLPEHGLDEGLEMLLKDADDWWEVEPSTPLARHQPATPGVEGYTVKGQILPANPGRRRKVGTDLFIDKHCTSQGDTLSANTAGVVYATPLSLSVSPLYLVDETPNEAPNEALIQLAKQHESLCIPHGLTDTVLEVEGHVRIQGDCQRVQLKAGGHIWIEGGIKGPSVIRAGGHLRALSARESLLYAGQSVHVEQLHSTQVFTPVFHGESNTETEHIQIYELSHPFLKEQRIRLIAEQKGIKERIRQHIQDLIHARRDKDTARVERLLVGYEALQRRIFFLVSEKYGLERHL